MWRCLEVVPDEDRVANGEEHAFRLQFKHCKQKGPCQLANPYKWWSDHHKSKIHKLNAADESAEEPGVPKQFTVIFEFSFHT
jgi:hypothetical protein